MKNLSHEDIDRVDALPKRVKVQSPNGSSRYRRFNAYPYNRVNRFLMSKVGKNWDTVYSEFCHLEWIPVELRTKEQIGQAVILNTFLEGGDVYCIEKYRSGASKIDDMHHPAEILYVHPKTNILSLHVKKKDNKHAKNERNVIVLGNYHQLVKVKGIWYELKGEPKESETQIIEKDGLQYRIVPDKELPPIHERNFAWGKGTNTKDINFFDTHYQIVDGKVVEPIKRHSSWRNDRKSIGPRDNMIDMGNNHRAFYYNTPDYRSIKITLYKQLTSKELKRHNLKNDIQDLPMNRCPKCGGFECLLHKTKEELNKLIW